MAGEVNIIEYGEQIYNTDGFIAGSSKPKALRTQAVTIGARSAALGGDTAYVIVKSNQTAMWVRPGNSAVNAAIDTAENFYIPSDGNEQFPVIEQGAALFTHIDTVVDS